MLIYFKNNDSLSEHNNTLYSCKHSYVNNTLETGCEDPFRMCILSKKSNYSGYVGVHIRNYSLFLSKSMKYSGYAMHIRKSKKKLKNFLEVFSAGNDIEPLYFLQKIQIWSFSRHFHAQKKSYIPLKSWLFLWGFHES